MNEPTQSIWKRPWQGRRALLLWLGLIFAASYIIIVCIGWLSLTNTSVTDLLVLGLAGAAATSVVVTLGFLFVRWLCNWRNLRRFAFVLACLATLIALAVAEENWRGLHAWNQFRSEWEARGEKFSILALAPPAVPDDKNFAMIPLLKPILEYTQTTTGIVWLDTNGQARAQELSPSLEPHRNTNDQLVLGSMEKGTFADLPACAAFYRGNTNYPQAPETASPAETMMVALDRFKPELKELDEAAADRPYCRFPIHYTDQPCWAILLPHLARIKGLTQLTHARAIAELELNRPADAFKDLQLGFRFSDCIDNEPILISHLVRIAALAIDLQTIREGLLRHAWTEAQLTQLETNLASLNLLAEHKFVMHGEQAFETEGLEYLKHNPRGARDVSSENNDSLPLFQLFPSGWYNQNMLTISRMLHEYSFAAVDEQARRIFPDITERGSRALTAMRTGPYTFVARMLLPALAKAVERSAREQIYVDSAQAACALERYRIANGTLPDSLELLVPKFIARIPNDVIDGKPLRYQKKSDGGYLLYSIGWNQTDDHGQLVWTKESIGKKEPRVDFTQGDWVWSMPK